MLPADRYAALLPPGVRERWPEAPAEWSELELQACWFAGEFGRDFRTVEGVPVRVVQFGVWNHEAGPDFSHAAVSFAGAPPVSGPLELDTEARDWERHGHAQNPAYEHVVLHVFTRASGAECFTRTARHRLVPQVRLDLSTLRGAPPRGLPEAHLGACAGPLGALPPERAEAVLLGAAEYRLRRKAAALARLGEVHGPEEALYQTCAAVLGYKSNKLPFTLLAQRLPLRLLLAQGEKAEALLFGVSGFLNEPDLRALPPDSRPYVRGLWEQWWPLRAEFERLVLPADAWQSGGQRPANHPQRRLAALAGLVRRWKEFARLAEEAALPPLTGFLEGLQHPYWEHHYTLLSRPSPRPMALVGSSRALEMMLNLFLPLATLRRGEAPVTFPAWRAPLTNRRVEVAATRLFGARPERHRLLRSAAVQQGLLQIYEDFCLQDATDCAQCPFPRQVAQW